MSGTLNYWPWIVRQGVLLPEEAAREAAGFVEANTGVRYIAFHADHFSSGWAASMTNEFTDTLLELRVFNEQAELRLFRSSVGSGFRFRLADDAALTTHVAALNTSDDFLKDPAHYIRKARQVLDINQKWPAYVRGERDANGCRLLCTTGGGHYALPLEGNEDLAVTVEYLAYDPVTGVCQAADARLAGFEKGKGAEKA